jgi:hypothetical protein
VGSESVKGDTAIAEYLATLWHVPSIGETPVAKAEIHEALISSKTIAPKDPESWASLNNSLSSKTFYSGNALSLADVAVYSALYVPFVRHYPICDKTPVLISTTRSTVSIVTIG